MMGIRSLNSCLRKPAKWPRSLRDSVRVRAPLATSAQSTPEMGSFERATLTSYVFQP